MPVLLTWNAIAAFSKEHVAKLVYRVLLLYLVVFFRGGGVSPLKYKMAVLKIKVKYTV